MICGITGVLRAVSEGRAILHVNSFDYEVLIPEFTRIKLQSMLEKDISLHTIQYLEGNPAQGRLTPRLVGFLSDIEREFFEMFCSVDGVGVKKALRAMVRPVRDVATLIEEQDAKGLSTLPGIGPATSERIIAKLRRKMPKFALIASTSDAAQTDVAPDIVRDTYQVLMSLGHSESDSRKLIDSAVAGKKKFKDVDSLIKEIYALVHN
ncbi:MAG: Holliday junction DNA helicase RuvA [Pirellulaceae bacterium]